MPDEPKKKRFRRVYGPYRGMRITLVIEDGDGKRPPPPPPPRPKAGLAARTSLRR